MLIINNCQLKQFYQECQKDKYIGVDTEFYWVGTYKPIPCLIQISNSKRIVLIEKIMRDEASKEMMCIEDAKYTVDASSKMEVKVTIMWKQFVY